MEMMEWLHITNWKWSNYFPTTQKKIHILRFIPFGLHKLRKLHDQSIKLLKHLFGWLIFLTVKVVEMLCHKYFVLIFCRNNPQCFVARFDLSIYWERHIQNELLYYSKIENLTLKDAILNCCWEFCILRRLVTNWFYLPQFSGKETKKSIRTATY